MDPGQQGHSESRDLGEQGSEAERQSSRSGATPALQLPWGVKSGVQGIELKGAGSLDNILF